MCRRCGSGCRRWKADAATILGQARNAPDTDLSQFVQGGFHDFLRPRCGARTRGPDVGQATRGALPAALVDGLALHRHPRSCVDRDHEARVLAQGPGVEERLPGAVAQALQGEGGRGARGQFGVQPVPELDQGLVGLFTRPGLRGAVEQGVGQAQDGLARR